MCYVLCCADTLDFSHIPTIPEKAEVTPAHSAGTTVPLLVELGIVPISLPSALLHRNRDRIFFSDVPGLVTWSEKTRKYHVVIGEW